MKVNHFFRYRVCLYKLFHAVYSSKGVSGVGNYSQSIMGVYSSMYGSLPHISAQVNWTGHLIVGQLKCFIVHFVSPL